MSFTQLMSAIERDYKPLIKSILQKNPEFVNECTTETKTTPLHVACGFLGNVFNVKYLLSKGADIHARDVHGNTPLIAACVNEMIGILKVLVSSRANVNARNHKGISPLYYACIYGHYDIARILIRAGADIHSRYYEDGTTPLERVDILLVNHYNENTEDPRQRKKFIQIGKLLIRSGAEVHDLQDNELKKYIVEYETELKTQRRWKIAASLVKTVPALKRWHRRAQEALIWDAHPDNPNGYMQRTLLIWGK